MNKYVISSIVIAAGMIAYSLYVTKCRGESCGPEANIASVGTFNNQIDTKMGHEEIQKEVASGEAILIDVREESEWQEGHIAGAKLMPLGSLNAETVKDLPKDLPIYLYCRSGRRADTAESLMQKLGFAKAKSIGGVIEWQENGGVLVK